MLLIKLLKFVRDSDKLLRTSKVDLKYSKDLCYSFNKQLLSDLKPNSLFSQVNSGSLHGNDNVALIMYSKKQCT